MTIEDKRYELARNCANLLSKSECNMCPLHNTHEKYKWSSPYHIEGCFYFLDITDDEIELAYKILKGEEDMKPFNIEELRREVDKLDARVKDLDKEVDEMEKLKPLKEGAEQMGYFRKCLIEEGFTPEEAFEFIIRGTFNS